MLWVLLAHARTHATLRSGGRFWLELGMGTHFLLSVLNFANQQPRLKALPIGVSSVSQVSHAESAGVTGLACSGCINQGVCWGLQSTNAPRPPTEGTGMFSWLSASDWFETSNEQALQPLLVGLEKSDPHQKRSGGESGWLRRQFLFALHEVSAQATLLKGVCF